MGTPIPPDQHDRDPIMETDPRSVSYDHHHYHGLEPGNYTAEKLVGLHSEDP